MLMSLSTEPNKNIGFLVLFSLSVALFFLAFESARGEEPADYWANWRARQRAELATLPRLTVPPGNGEPTLDRFLEGYWAKHHLTPPAVVDDRVYARRVFLDVSGLLP